MSFAWLHKKISLRASIVAICVTVLATIICLKLCLFIYESKINGDTPEICQLYLEQNAFVHDHFGELQKERFLKDESAAFIQEPNLGTLGLYTFEVTGTKAKGLLKMIWARELRSGALTVSAINITDEHPLAHPVTDQGPKEAEPRLSGLPTGPLAIISPFLLFPSPFCSSLGAGVQAIHLQDRLTVAHGTPHFFLSWFMLPSRCITTSAPFTAATSA